MNACRHELGEITGTGFQSRPPPKRYSTMGHYSNNVSPSKQVRMNNQYRGGRSGDYGNRGQYRGSYPNRGNNWPERGRYWDNNGRGSFNR